MRKNYDFKNSKKNPYLKRIRSKKIAIEPDASISLSDILKISEVPRKRDVERELKRLEKRIERLEGKVKR